METLSTAVPKTTLPVEDLVRARAFYAEKVGLRRPVRSRGRSFRRETAPPSFFSS
jgi:hypothetical protein